MMHSARVFRIAILSALSLGVAMSVSVPAARAQFAPRGRPVYGYANLREGFMPDPHIMNGTLGGPVQANQINSSCRGYVTPQPSHVLRSPSGFRNLRIIVSAQSDATLMVMLPNGQILCDDDGGEAMNPLIQVTAPRGQIAVWVGAYSQSSVGVPYTLGFSELSHVTAGTLGMGNAPPPIVRPGIPQVAGPLQPNMPPNFGSVNLRSGFMPDPQIVAGTAGGPISASQINSSCRGWVTPQPSHVVMSQTGFRNLRFVVNSGTDTTLVVMLPNGQILCNDDGGGGSNPLVEGPSPPGPIRVWVGTYSSGRQAPYNIGFSELSGVSAANIPPPGGGTVVQQPVQPVQPVVVPDLVPMVVSIPVTLMGPGMGGNTVAVWNPTGGPQTQVSLSGRSLMAAGINLGSVPPSMQDPVITVTQRRDGTLLVRAEQPPEGGPDRGQAFLLLVRWAGRPTVQERWSGTSVERGPRWAR
jgi:hypothetical protein